MRQRKGRKVHGENKGDEVRQEREKEKILPGRVGEGEYPSADKPAAELLFSKEGHDILYGT
jgi:hypothetical protein